MIDFRQLFPKYGIKPTGVLHVGANVGEEAPVYDELGIIHVCWIEANKEIYDKLCENLRKSPSKWTAFNKCISDTDGEEVSFNISIMEASPVQY